MNKLNQQKGFTLVELLVAMTLFTFILMAISVGFIQVMRMYQNGLASRRTQQAARFITQEMSRDIRNSDAVYVRTITSGEEVLCLQYGSNAVYYYLYQSGPSAQQRKLRRETSDEIGFCLAASFNIDNTPNDSRELVDDEVIITELSFTPLDSLTTSIGPITGYRSVQINMTTNTNTVDLLNGSAGCDPAADGAQYCAASKVDTIATVRGGS